MRAATRPALFTDKHTFLIKLKAPHLFDLQMGLINLEISFMDLQVGKFLRDL